MANRVIRVLHVDDIEEEFILMRELLASSEYTTFELHWAPDAATAMRVIQTTPFDVCLVDYYLGKDNGLEFIRTALTQGISTPFILMSGQGNHAINREAIRIGVRQCVDKNDMTTSILVKALTSATRNS
jgi:DNA-binding NtrC family response regulator